MKDYLYIKSSRLEADRVVKQALDIINREIQNGSLVYLYELDRKDFSIKLKHPIGIVTADFPEVGENFA